MAAQRIVELPIPPPPAGDNRVEVQRQFPTGALILGVVVAQGYGARLVAKGDPTAPPVVRHFVLIQNGVPMTSREDAGVYWGSFPGYVRSPGNIDLWHVFEVAAP